MALKCKINMTDKILPAPGSVKGPEGKTTGTCPDCDTPGVMLSIVGGFVRAHTVADSEIPANNPQAPTLIAPARSHPHGSDKVSTGLSEPQVELTDTGVREGDPRAAEKRRTIELHGAAGTGTVKLPRKVDSGAKLKSGAPRMVTKMVEFPATEATVREALEYWRTKVIRAPKEDASPSAMDSFRARGTQQSAMVSELVRLLEAIMAAQVVRYDTATRQLTAVHTPAFASAMVDTAQAHRGPTLVRGRDTPPRLREHGLSWEESTDLRQDGSVRKTSTLDQPLGRERFDRTITFVPEPAPVLSRSQKRAARRKTCRATHQARTAVQAARA